MEEEYFNIRGYQFKFVNQGLLFFSNGDWRLDGEYDTFKQAYEAAEDMVNDYYDMRANL
tara:strand:- start:179 stop:355 length:177 start_codon:yes stop_codon:yes gene_type:complete